METNRKERRRYSVELKKRVVKEFEAGKMTQGNLTRLYGLRKGAIWDWLQEYGTIYFSLRDRARPVLSCLVSLVFLLK